MIKSIKITWKYFFHLHIIAEVMGRDKLGDLKNSIVDLHSSFPTWKSVTQMQSGKLFSSVFQEHSQNNGKKFEIYEGRQRENS